MPQKHLPPFRRTLLICLCIVTALGLLSACATQPAASLPAQQAAEPLPAEAPAATPEAEAPCALPDLKYETESYALSSLRARGAMAVIEYEEDGTVPSGLVTAQSVEPGVCAESGKPVTIIVSKPVSTPEPTPTPEPSRKPETTQEPPMLIVPEEVSYVDPNFPTVTPQPTRDPAIEDFFNSHPDQPAGDCG